VKANPEAFLAVRFHFFNDNKISLLLHLHHRLQALGADFQLFAVDFFRLQIDMLSFCRFDIGMGAVSVLSGAASA